MTYLCDNYSLAKECPWAEHFTSLPKRGVSALLSVPHLTTKERPCPVYSNSMPLKQITEQLCTTEPPATSKLSHDDTQRSHRNHVNGANGISYVHPSKHAF